MNRYSANPLPNPLSDQSSRVSCLLNWDCNRSVMLTKVFRPILNGIWADLDDGRPYPPSSLQRHDTSKSQSGASFQQDVFAIEECLEYTDRADQPKCSVSSDMNNRFELTPRRLPAIIDMIAPKKDPRARARTLKYSVR